MNQGWIKLHRELMDKPIWLQSTPEQKVILITLLTMANHEERQWEWKGQKFIAKPGQFITSIKSIVDKCGDGISTQNVRSAIKRFEKFNFLTNQSTKQNRLITIENWGFYQGRELEGNKDPNNQLTKTQQRPNNQLTTNKNVRMQEDYIYNSDIPENMILEELPPLENENRYEYMQRRVKYKLSNNGA